MAQKQKKIVGQNRKARHAYTIQETLEAGVVLLGSEVKSLRSHTCAIAESYVAIDKKSHRVEWVNAHIPSITTAKYFGHEERRPRALLIHAKEAKKLAEALHKKGCTAIPLEVYFTSRGKVKVLIAIAQGRKEVDKRHAIKERDWARQKARVLKGA